ncbi:(2Fe-2S)-binding protein [Actinoplanes sp. HUAS TT8]|uniref:(2Fe-2S)-binding protein n=1 Tax=Actinoplanes sp. HUAS TT8 TaxID=3447453 RepID=UPI003F51D5B0
MYVCICHHVRENQVRAAIRCGASDEEAVGDACGAGTGCGSCLDRIADLLEEEGNTDTRLPSAA